MTEVSKHGLGLELRVHFRSESRCLWKICQRILACSHFILLGPALVAVALARILSAKPWKAAEGPYSAKPFPEGTVASAEALRKGSWKDLFPHSKPPQGLGSRSIDGSTYAPHEEG